MLDQLDNIADILAFSLTSRSWWHHCFPRFTQYRSSCLGQWADENIVCLGELNDSGDYPPGLFNNDEYVEIGDRADLGPPRLDGKECLVLHLPDGVWSWLPAYRPIKNMNYLYDRLYNMAGHQALRGIDSGCIFTELKTKPSMLKMLYPEDQKWVLRNLTTKEFVRAEAIAL